MSLTTQERTTLLSNVDSLRLLVDGIPVSDVDVAALQAQLAATATLLTSTQASLAAAESFNAALTTQVQALQLRISNAQTALAG